MTGTLQCSVAGLFALWRRKNTRNIDGKEVKTMPGKDAELNKHVSHFNEMLAVRQM
jgi:hypothetical protein